MAKKTSESFLVGHGHCGTVTLRQSPNMLQSEATDTELHSGGLAKYYCYS
jgi:hypothetical protein